MKKRDIKKKHIAKVISRILILLLIFTLLLIIMSAKWFLVYFKELDISAAIYQITTPLKGTSWDVMWEFSRMCVLPAVIVTASIGGAYWCYDMIMDKMYFDINVKMHHYLSKTYTEFTLHCGKKFRRISKFIIALMTSISLISALFVMAIQVKLPEYIRQRLSTSEIIEANYVAPHNVSMIFPEKKRNLILIYMESMESTYASQGTERTNYIPELTELASRGVNFSNTDDIGGAYQINGAQRTIEGMQVSQTGVPYKLPIGTVDAEHEFLPGIMGMGDILKENGYKNYFMCGSDIDYGGREAFLKQHGDYTILDLNAAYAENFIPEDYYVFWGMEDAKLYEYAKKHLTEMGESGTPFNFNILTVDTHFSEGYLCELCKRQYDEQYANVIACASSQVYQFVEWLEKQEWFENTTIVIIGDHLSMNGDFFDSEEGINRRIYNCFYNLPDGLEARQMKNREFNTTDLFPTILASMGVSIQGDRLGIGTNLFSEKETLQEQFGAVYLNTELSKYSKFYYDNFVLNSGGE